MVNRAFLIGRIGTAPKIENPRAPLSFSVATSEFHKGEGENQFEEETTWHRVSYFGPNEEARNRLSGQLEKGALVYVEGQIECRKYEADGVSKEIYRIKAYKVKVLGRSASNSGEPAKHEAKQEKPAKASKYAKEATNTSAADNDEFNEDDLPF